eukprot:163714-Pleurochrysis_carterae.AAC.1
MSAVDVLGARVVFWPCGRFVRFAEFLQQSAEVSGLLGCLRGCDNLRLAGGQSHRRLFLAAPSDGCLAWSGAWPSPSRRTPPLVTHPCAHTGGPPIGGVIDIITQHALRGGQHIGSEASRCATEHAHRVGDVGATLLIAGSGTTPCDLASRAASTRRGRSSAAGVWFLWKVDGTPSGRYVSISCAMYFSCFSSTQSASVVMSTLRRSETGPSSSTFHRDERAEVNDEYKEPGFEPWKKRSLPAASSLRHAVYRLDDAAHACAPVGSNSLVSRRRVTVHDFARFQVTLKMSGDKVPPAHGQSTPSG